MDNKYIIRFVKQNQLSGSVYLLTACSYQSVSVVAVKALALLSVSVCVCVCVCVKLKAKAQVLGIAPLNMRSMCQRRFTIVEVVTDQHWL